MGQRFLGVGGNMVNKVTCAMQQVNLGFSVGNIGLGEDADTALLILPVYGEVYTERGLLILFHCLEMPAVGNPVLRSAGRHCHCV